MPDNPGLQLGPFRKEIKVHEGLDLQGGLQVVLEADVPPIKPSLPTRLTRRSRLSRAASTRSCRGAADSNSGQPPHSRQLPGLTNPDDAIRTFGSTGQLEFIDAGDTGLDAGAVVQTTGLATVVVPGAATPTPALATPTRQPTVAPTAAITTTGGVTSTAPLSPTTPVTPTYRTVMTGRELRSAQVAFQQTTNQPYISFELSSEGAKIFSDYTTKNVNKFLAITLDKRVISSPVIKSAITEGKGIIEGRFTLEEAKSLVLQLKYGALPVRSK